MRAQPCLQLGLPVLEPPGQAWRVPRAGQASRIPAIPQAPDGEVRKEPAPRQAVAGEATEPDPARVPLPVAWVVGPLGPAEAEPLKPGPVPALPEKAQGQRSGQGLAES